MGKGPSGIIFFSLLLLAASVASAQPIQIVSGNGQITCQICFPAVSPAPLVAKTTPGTTVTWTSSGQHGLDSSQTVADAQGNATVRVFALNALPNTFSPQV